MADLQSFSLSKVRKKSKFWIFTLRYFKNFLPIWNLIIVLQSVSHELSSDILQLKLKNDAFWLIENLTRHLCFSLFFFRKIKTLWLSSIFCKFILSVIPKTSTLIFKIYLNFLYLKFNGKRVLSQIGFQLSNMNQLDFPSL